MNTSSLRHPLQGPVPLALGAGTFAGLLAIASIQSSLIIAPAALAAICVGFLAVTRPIWAIYLAIVLIPFEAATAQTGGGVGITPTEATFVAAALGWTIRRLTQGGQLPKSILIPPLLLLLAAHIPGLFLAANPFAVFKQLFMWTMGFLLFVAVLSDDEPETLKRMALAISIAGGLVAAVAIYKTAGGQQLASEAGGIVTNRAVGPFASPVLLGIFITITMPVQLVLMIRGENNLIRLVALGALVLSVAALALALTRSAFLDLGVAFAFLAIFWRPARRLALVLVILVLFLFVTRINPAPSTFDTSVITKRLSSIGTETHTAQLRFQLWRKSPEIFWDNFPFGIGPKNLPVRAQDYGLVFNVGAPSNVHNTWLIIATELGVPGLVAMLWLGIAIVRTLIGAMKVRGKLMHGFALAMVATFLALLADSVPGYSYSANAYFLVTIMLLAMTARLDKLAKQQMAERAHAGARTEEGGLPPAPPPGSPAAREHFRHPEPVPA
jgi:O-antigen ligase